MGAGKTHSAHLSPPTHSQGSWLMILGAAYDPPGRSVESESSGSNGAVRFGASSHPGIDFNSLRLCRDSWRTGDC